MKKKLNCVLLVDDDESDNFFHKRVIEKAGITERIGIALNGKEALDFLVLKGDYRQSDSPYCQPELIFLDINMPVMDGWEFLEEYHKLEEVQKGNIVFILLTTSLNPADKTRAKKVIERVHFQFKPLTLDIINTIIQKYFPDYL
jgi:CheY-like chemotaxis protein